MEMDGNGPKRLATIDLRVPVSELNASTLLLAAILGLSLACFAYQKCAKPVLDEQDFKRQQARKEARKAREKRP